MSKQQVETSALGTPPEQTSKSDELRDLAESTAVGEVMSRSAVCIAPEARVDTVTEMFLERGISCAPIVNDAWQPLGMVSKTDLLRVISEEGGLGGESSLSGAAQARVRDVAMPHVLSLHEEAPISVAAALMAYEGVHRLPIVATSGEVIGIISTLDIIRWVARCADLDVSGEK